jgi:hypothetical protein
VYGREGVVCVAFVFLIVGLSSHRVLIGEDAFATIHSSAIKASTL